MRSITSLVATALPRRPRSTTVSPGRVRATANASASVALVITSPRSTPRWTIVWAICGRMPLMMQSAPISRAAATVFSRCCATSVSTVGTPVMSMIAIAAPVSTIALQQVLHDDLGARAVERADQRQRQDAVPQLDHGRGQLQHLLLLPADDLFAALLVDLGRVEPELVEERASSSRSRRPARPDPRRAPARRRSKSGCLSEKTKVAVSDGLKPCRARACVMSPRMSRTPDHSACSISSSRFAAGFADALEKSLSLLAILALIPAQ